MIQAMTINELSPRAGARFGFPLLNKKSTGSTKCIARPAKQPKLAPPPAVADRDAQQAEEALLLAAQVRLAQRGDSTAMAELIESNRTWIRGIAYSVLGDA